MEKQVKGKAEDIDEGKCSDSDWADGWDSATLAF